MYLSTPHPSLSDCVFSMVSMDVKRKVVDSFMQFETGLHTTNSRDQAQQLESSYKSLVSKLPQLDLCDDTKCNAKEKHAKKYLQGVLKL
jgi:hypothetical protein